MRRTRGPRRPNSRPRTGSGWASELEAVEPDEAQDAYRRALALDPTHADAHVNLGRLLQERGRLEEAVLQYARRFVSYPARPAAFNLGHGLRGL